MIKIGDICPLFFNPIKNEFQQDIDYIQRFHITDQILFQVLSDDSSDVVSCYVKDLVANENILISLNEYQINSTTILYQAQISVLKDSIYKLVVEEKNTGDVHESELFSICSDDILLQETCLIRYSHEDNNSPFDNIFWIGESQQFFEFRVEGGFKPGGISSKVDNEQFRNQLQEIVELYSVPYDVYTFTCGNASGVPYWIVQFINNILSLSHFSINEKMYVRSGNSIPEKTAASEDGQMFNATMILEDNNNEYLILSPSLIEAGPAAASYIISVKSNTVWAFEVTEGEDFITYDDSNQGKRNGILTFKVSDMPGNTDRSGTILFISEDGTKSAVRLVQKKAFINISPVAGNDVGIAGSKKITITSNIDYDIASDSTWLTVDKSEGNAGITEILFRYPNNDTNEMRTGYITVTGKSPYQATSAKFLFNQFVTPDKFLIINPSKLNLNEQGDSQTINISGFKAWRVLNKPDWITVSPGSAGSILGEYAETDVLVGAEGNTEGVVRNAEIEIMTYDGYMTKVIEVSQEGTPKFETVPTDIINVPASGGTRTVQLYCTNENWLLTYVPNWVNVEPNTGTDDAVLTVTIEPNTGAARNEAIQIDNLGTGATLEIGVYQLAASSGKYLNVSDYYYNNNGIAVTIQIGVDTNVDDLIIEVADYPSWLEDAFLSASNDTLNLLYGANPNSTPQFAVVKFVSEKYPEVNKDFYAINGAPAGLDYSVLIPPGDGGVIEQERSAGTIKTYLFDNVTTYLDDEGTSWFSGIDYDAEPGKGKVVKIYPKANTTSTERIANIICKRGSDDEILSGIEVRQSATGYYIEHDGEPNIIVGSSAVTVSRTITVGTSIPNNPTATSEATWINSIKVTPMVNDDFNVQFKVAVNSTGVERTGIVRVTFMDVHYDFSITQGK